MAQYWLDFTDDTIGQAPIGLTTRWTANGLTMAVQSDASAPSGKSVRITKTITNRSITTVDAVDADDARDNFEIRALVRTPASASITGTPAPFLAGRASGAAGAENAYAGGLLYGSAGVFNAELRKYASGTLTANLGSGTTTPSAFANSTLYWLRLRVNGTSIERGLAQANDPDTETWTVSTTDSAVTGDGWIGLLTSGACVWDVLAIGVGTGSDLAPTSGTAPDTTAPTLSGASGTATGAASATGSVTTDEDNGTLYAVATTSATAPSAAQVKAGQDHTGSTAPWSGNQAVSSTGEKTFSVTGLSASTAYYLHYMHEDAAANQSTVATSSSFTTDTPDTTAPTLTSPTATATSTTTASASVSTNESNGTLYYLASENSTESAATVKAASSQSVTAIGSQSVSITGLSAETSYYVHFVHRDSSGNDSTVATSAQITTPAGIVIRADYERSSVNLSGSSVSGIGDDAVVTIKPRVQESEVIGSQSKWLEPSARIDNVNGVRPTFKFIDYSKYHGTPWNSRKPMFSYDRNTWYYFDTCTVNADDITFRHNSAFTSGTVYVGRVRQMSVTQIGAWLDDLADTYPSIIGPAPSAVGFTPTLTEWPGQAFIADEFSAQVNELGQTIPATPLYAAKIGTGSTLGILSCGVHAGEDHPHYVYKKTVEALCGSSAEAIALRERYTILLYPMVNAPGRAGGGFRGSFTQGVGGADDLNRHFSETTSGLEIVDIPKAAMVADVGSYTVAFAIDYHAAYTNTWAMYDGDAVEEEFRTTLTSESGFNVVSIGSFTSDALGRWYGTGLGATLATIVEFCAPSPVTDAAIQTMGIGIVGALESMSTDKDIPWDWPVPIALSFSDIAPATLLNVQVWSKMPKKTDVESLY